MRYKGLSLLLIILICVFIFSSCGYSPKNAEMAPKLGDAQKGGNIRISAGHPDTLNPLKTQIQSNYNMLMLVFEGLFLVQNDQCVVPVLAEDYTLTDDGLEYTITLKKNIKFHDGKYLTSKDVVYTMRNINKYCPKYNNLFSNIDIFYPMGNDKVIIKLKTPMINFVSNLTFPILSEITPLSAFEGNDVDFVPVGTGEFMFDKKISRTNILLKRNPDWHEKTGYIDAVEVLFVDNIQTAMYSFNANVVDIITTNEYRWGDFSLTENFKTFEYENNVYEYIGFNKNNKVFSGSNVKKAIYTAIDRDYITEEIMHSHAKKAHIPVQSGSYFYPDSQKAKNPDKDIIISLLDSDGWVDVDNDDIYEKNVGQENYELSFKFLINEDEAKAMAIATSVAKSLAEYKIYAEIVALPSDRYETAYRNGDYDLILAKTYMDTAGFFMNMPGNLSDDMKNKLNEMCFTKDKESFREQMNDLCQLFLEEYPHVPLFFETSALFLKNNVKGTPKPSHSWVYNGITDLFVKIKDGTND